MRILLVDAEEGRGIQTRALIERALGPGVEVRIADCYEQALEIERAHPPCAVIVEARVSGRTAIAYLEARARDGLPPPAVVIGSDPGDPDDVTVLRGGAADYLPRAELDERTIARVVRHSIERHHALAAAWRLEVRQQLLVASVGAIVWQGNADTMEFTFVSREAEALLGYPVEQWTSEPGFWRSHMHPDDRDWAVAFCQSATRRNEAHTFDYRMIAADGRVVWLRDIVRVTTIGGRRELAGVMVDITPARLAEDQLRLQERAIAAITEGILIVDPHQPDMPIVAASAGFERLTGYPASEVVGRNCRFLQGPGTDPAAVHEIRCALAQRRPVTVEILNYRRDGTPFWNRLSVSPVMVKDRLTHFVGVQLDVTEERRARTEAAAIGAHYRRLVSTAPLAIFALDAEGRFIELNEAGEQITGYPGRTLIGRHFTDLVAEQDVERASVAVARILADGDIVLEQELPIVRPTGDERLVSLAIASIREGDRITGIHGIARDITEERMRERQVRRLASALENLRDEGIIITDEAGRILYVNRTHARIFGYDARHAPATVETFLPDEMARMELLDIVGKVHRDGSWSGLLRRRRVDGTLVDVDAIIEAVREDGALLFVSIVRMARERLDREQHLRRVERLASVGTLMAGVAHELNNPIGAIMGLTDLLLNEDLPESAHDDLRVIAREAERVARIVSDLRRVARNTQDTNRASEIVDINDIVRHVLKTRRYSLHTHNIEVREDLADELPGVLANRGEMEQVLLNLVVNAEQAMADAERRLLIVRTRVSGTGVSIHVFDSGAGIPREQIERIFDPFFTTKSPGEGTGLGLALVHGIVSENGGEIRVDSEPGKGTAFRIELPAVAATTGAAVPAPAPAPPSRPLRVMVVDDEEPIRRVVARVLARRGHAVDEASDGQQAFDLVQRRDYDVIISDLRMPGLGGEELISRLRTHAPGMERRVILLTGDTASPEAARILAESRVMILAKPADIADVVRVTEELGAAAG